MIIAIQTLNAVLHEKLEDLLKALLKDGLKISPRSVNYLEKNYNTWVILILSRRKEYMLDCCVVD